MGETGAVVVKLTGIIYMLKKIINIISSFTWPKEPLKQWSPKKVLKHIIWEYLRTTYNFFGLKVTEIKYQQSLYEVIVYFIC